MPKMPPTLPARRLSAPVRFKSETKTEMAHRMDEERTSTKPDKKLSNKEIALVLIASHVEDSFFRLTDEQMAIAAGLNLRGSRPLKVREFYKKRVEKMLVSIRKLLGKKGLDARITSFLPQRAQE